MAMTLHYITVGTRPCDLDKAATVYRPVHRWVSGQKWWSSALLEKAKVSNTCFGWRSATVWTSITSQRKTNLVIVDGLITAHYYLHRTYHHSPIPPTHPQLSVHRRKCSTTSYQNYYSLTSKSGNISYDITSNVFWPEPHRAHLEPAEADTGGSYPTPKWPSRTASSTCRRVERIASKKHHEMSEENKTSLSSWLSWRQMVEIPTIDMVNFYYLGPSLLSP